MANQDENFIVSARKYRPEEWNDVIGQGSITETLQKSINQNHLAHAYLFCGPRGVGKTTCARIFAKEINRSEEHAEDEDFSFNLFELDAASNNSVDDIRALTDQVRIPPQVGNYKVYIIDEVHMLSKAAFNAFLKTLEEPPKHAIFILATTEKHKIIPTILSRCQIYDFNRIRVEEIVDQLKHIAASESVKYDEEALHVIAQKADGALRDALSIFDQLSSFTNQNLTYDSVLKNLHVLDYDYYFKLTDHLVSQQYSDTLLILDDILKQGFDGAHFISGISTHLRDLLVCQYPQTAELLEVGKSVQELYLKQAKEVDPEWLTEALPLVADAEFKYRNAPNQRLLLEVTLLRLCNVGLEKKNANPEQESIREPALSKRSKPSSEGQTPTSSQPINPQPEIEEKSAASIPQDEEKSQVHDDTAAEQDEQIDEKGKPTESTEKANPVTQPQPEQSTVKKQEEQPTTSTRIRRTTTVSLNVDDPPNSKVEEESRQLKDVLEQDDSQQIKGNLNPADAWKALCDESLNDGNSALYSILAKQETEKQWDGDAIVIHLNHEVDQEEFNHHNTAVLQRLRQLTGNNALTLQTELKKTDTKVKLFTSQEKFDHLSEQNPSLRKLKQDLDLDFI